MLLLCKEEDSLSPIAQARHYLLLPAVRREHWLRTTTFANLVTVYMLLSAAFHFIITKKPGHLHSPLLQRTLAKVTGIAQGPVAYNVLELSRNSKDETLEAD